MTVGVQMRTAKFSAAVKHFKSEFSLNAELELKRQGRLFVRDCIQFTPPFQFDAPSSTSLNAHRRIGEGAVISDLNKVFAPVAGKVNVPKVNRLRGDTFNGLSFDRIADPKKRERVQQLIREYAAAGNRPALERVLTKMKFKFAGIIPFVDPQMHKLRRNRRGRTRTAGGQYLVMDNYKLRDYVLTIMRQVGFAKSGWQKAYYALGGQALPRWISEHHGPGIYGEGRDASGMFVRVGNAVPYIQETGSELRIMQRAYDNRARNIAREMAAIMVAAKKRSGF